MALVLLPCDLPTWPAVIRHLNQIKEVQTSAQLIEGMQKLHAVCCISLDPDENDRSNIEIFSGLQLFLDVAMNDDERQKFFQVTLPSLLTFALRLKLYKPINGLHYSLQQQGDCSELDRRFVASLVANAFFSTFPRRTLKTHPTLQDCNFARFFIHLKSAVQQRKFRQFLAYFELMASQEPKGKVVFIRQVMPKKAELDLSDWLHCEKTLCPVVVRHEGKVEQAEFGSLKVCFVSSRMGGLVLDGGDKNEDLIFSAFPELLVALLSTEVLEYNEAFTAHGLLPINDLLDHRDNSCFPQPVKDLVEIHGVFNTHVCLIDFKDYHLIPESQYLETSIVRELNKAFAGFRQQPMSYMRIPPMGKSCSSTPPEDPSPIREAVDVDKDSATNDQLPLTLMKSLMAKRGAGFGLCGLVNQLKHRVEETKMCTNERDDCVTPDCGSVRTLQGSPCDDNVNITDQRTLNTTKSIAFVENQPSFVHRRAQDLHLLDREDSDESMYRDCTEDFNVVKEEEESEEEEDNISSGGLAFQRPLRLSSGCTKPKSEKAAKKPSLEGATMDASFISCRSEMSSSSSEENEDLEEDEEGFKSCSEEVDDDFTDEYNASRRTTIAMSELPLDLETPFGRRILTNSLHRRVRPSVSRTETDDSSYAVDSDIVDPELLRDTEGFLLRRTASTGFMLDEDEDIFLGDGLEHEREWMAHFRHRSTNPSRSLSRRNSSRYSFSSDFSSDLDDIYEHFEEKMTEGPVWDDPSISCRLGDRLKRTLSDSLTSLPRVTHGVPRSLSLTEKMQQERLSIEYAKQNVSTKVDRDTPQPRNVSFDNHGTTAAVTQNDTDVDTSSSERIGQLVGTTNVVSIEQNLSDVEESVTLFLPLSHNSRGFHLPRLQSHMSVWWNYNSVYDFCVPLNQFKKSRRSTPPQDNDDEDNCCFLTVSSNSYSDVDRSSSRRSFNLEVIEENYSENLPDLIITGTNQLPEQRNWTNGFGDIQPKGSTSLQLPHLGVYRSKSASNTDELERMSRLAEKSTDDAILPHEITRSCSLKDMKDLNSIGHDDKTATKKIEILMLNDQPKLKKWQAAFNLNDLDREESKSDQAPAEILKISPESGAAKELEKLRPVTKTKIKEYVSSKTANGETTNNDEIEGSSRITRDLEVSTNLNRQKQIVTTKIGTSAKRNASNCVENSLYSGMIETTNCLPSPENKRKKDCDQLLQQILEHDDGFRPITTGNYNRDDGKCGDPQLRVLIQWMAASKADAPYIIYYTGGDHQIVKFNVVSRLLLDRRWSVSNIAKAILSYYEQPHNKLRPSESEETLDLFESLLPKETDL